MERIRIGELLVENEAARLLRLQPATLRNWRAMGVGPDFVKIGSAVFYLREEIDAFACAYACGVLPRQWREYKHTGVIAEKV